MNYFLHNPDEDDYFNILYREHYLQSFASYKFCSKIKKSDLKEEFKIELGINPKSNFLFKNVYLFSSFKK